MSDDHKLEGHLYSESEPHFPMPVHQDKEHPLKQIILEKYDALLSNEVFNPVFNTGVQPDWKKIEQHVICYRGVSGCRCCGQLNGSREYRYNGWAWPQGFRHYIEEHNVVPSKEFLKEVLGIEV
jgi:hypothetical protein